MKRTFLVIVTTLSAAACGAKSPADAESHPTGAIVIRRSELRTGTLLEGIKPRLPMMTTSERAGQCPLVTFRGLRTFSAADTPSIYVDGTMMTNTCALIEISSSDVEVVEVYTSGAAGRAGVQRNPAGVILVFRRQK
jgi:hypothetical protein